MSVIMTLSVKGDPEKLEQHAASDRTGMQGFSNQRRERGLIAHRFYGSEDGEIMVVDEWPDEQSFRSFFEENGGLHRCDDAGCRRDLRASAEVLAQARDRTTSSAGTANSGLPCINVGRRHGCRRNPGPMRRRARRSRQASWRLSKVSQPWLATTMDKSAITRATSSCFVRAPQIFTESGGSVPNESGAQHPYRSRRARHCSCGT